MPLLDYLKDRRILLLTLLVLMLLVADLIYGIHLGIEFIGGTQIPITLEHQVNPGVLGSLISTLQQRTATFGLKQVTIEGVGSSEVYVIIPTTSQSEIASTIAVIEKQGVFQGVVNGREALNGSAILGGNIQPAPPTVSGGNVTWSVSFYVTQQAALKFSRAAFGQTGKPLYMFLDRPSNTIILLNESVLTTGLGTEANKITAMHNALLFENNTVPVEILGSDQGNWPALYSFFYQGRRIYSSVLLERATSNSIISNLTAMNYSLVFQRRGNMTPSFLPASSNNTQSLIVNSWQGVGLLSSPLLNPGVTNGYSNQGYTITGSAPFNTSLQGRVSYAQNQSTQIASILSGGALPVHVIVGLPITTPPTLGKHFEIISAIALVLAVVAVTATIVIRYRKAFLIGPIIMTTLAELFIIVSVIGVIGTIDLSAVAGMIAVIGTGVDAQIIITDEILSGSREVNLRIKLQHAFYVVWIGAGLLFVAMLPLFFSSSLITVIGFAESTILGAILGAFVTRPAYGAIISRHYPS